MLHFALIYFSIFYRVRDVINVFAHIKQVRQSKPIKPVILDVEYISTKNNVIKAERRVLKELGFCVHIKHPHKLIVMYLQLLGFEKHEKFMQMSWNFMNDSLRTDVFVRYMPETIACACIYLSARKLLIPLPKRPAWYDILGVEEDDIRDCCYRIICLYQRSKPNQEDLEKIVETLKNTIDSKRKADRGVSNHVSAVNSPASQTSSPKRVEENGTNVDKENSKTGKDDVGQNRSRSRSHERKKRKKHKRSRSRSGSDRENKKGDRKKVSKKHERSPSSHSPTYKKNNRHRSRSRSRERYIPEKERRGERYERYLDKNDKYPDKNDKGDKYTSDKRDKSEKYDHRVYSDKYKKGERIDREYYSRR